MINRLFSQNPTGGARPSATWRAWRPGSGTAMAITLAVGLLAWPGRSEAYEALVQATVSSQTYQLRDAGDNALTVSRLDTYLRLFVLDILPKKERKGGKEPTQMHFVAGMRLRADLGDYTRKWDRSFQVHGAEGGINPTFELLYAHLAVTDLAGFIDLKLGRQFHLDPMDFYGFDGLLARFRLPFHVALETIAGLRQAGIYGKGFADAPIYLLQGLDNTDQNPGWMPMVGVAAETHGLSFLTVRFAYRAVWHVLDESSPGRIYPTADGESIPTTQLTEQMLSAHATATFWKQRLQVYGGVRYNLVTTRLAEAQGGIAGRFGPARIRAEYVMDSPDFDGDSIFNIFNTQPYQEVRLWYEHRFNARWAAYARASLRLFAGGASNAPLETERKLTQTDAGGGLGGTYLGSRQSARLDLYWQEGYGGRTLGAFGLLRARVVPRWLDLEGRAVVAHWKDELSVTPTGVTAGITAGARVTFAPQVALHVLLEDNFGTYSRSDLRLLALLDVSWCTAGTCPAGAVLP